MTENIFGWLILGALVILILLAIFGKRRIASRPGSCPPRGLAGSELNRFFAGVEEGVENGLLQMGKCPKEISHETYQRQDTPKYYYSSAPANTPVKKKAVRTIPAPKKKSLLLSYKGLKAIIFGLLILSSVGTYAGNVFAQQILMGSDGQPVRQSGYQTQSFVQTQDYTTTLLAWIAIAVLFIVGLGMYWAQKKEMVFFNDRTDMWASIVSVMFVGFLFFVNNGSLVIYGAGGIIAYHFYCAFRYNPGNIARAFIMAVSRIVIGVMVPVLAFFIFFLGSSKEKDESAGAYAIRSAIHAAFQAAMLAGLFFFMRSLVNGDEVRNTRGETNFSESYFSRVFSNWWATFKKQSYSKEKASFNEHSSYSERSYSKERSSTNEQAYSRTSSNEQSSSNKQNNFKTTPHEEPSDYDILGVPKTASFEDIHRAYRGKMLKTHPDRLAKMGAKYRRMAEEECKKINAAFDRLRKARNYAFA